MPALTPELLEECAAAMKGEPILCKSSRRRKRKKKERQSPPAPSEK